MPPMPSMSTEMKILSGRCADACEASATTAVNTATSRVSRDMAFLGGGDRIYLRMRARTTYWTSSSSATAAYTTSPRITGREKSRILRSEEHTSELQSPWH